MNIKANLKSLKSKKTGKDYLALEIEFPNGYKKLVFLETAEQYMLSALASH